MPALLLSTALSITFRSSSPSIHNEFSTMFSDTEARCLVSRSLTERSPYTHPSPSFLFLCLTPFPDSSPGGHSPAGPLCVPCRFRLQCPHSTFSFPPIIHSTDSCTVTTSVNKVKLCYMRSAKKYEITYSQSLCTRHSRKRRSVLWTNMHKSNSLGQVQPAWRSSKEAEYSKVLNSACREFRDHTESLQHSFL